MNTEYPVLEADLARELGVPKDEMRELRKKHLDGGDFTLGRGGTSYTLEAAARIRKALGVPEKKEAGELPGLDSHEAGTAEASEKKGAAATDAPASGADKAVVTLYVKSCPRNPRIVLATLTRDLTGSIVRVRVKSNANFIPRMEIRAIAEAADLYSLAGRCPRYRGRF